jgi:hypothetical protein
LGADQQARIDEAIELAKQVCLVGSKYDFKLDASGALTIIRIQPGAAIKVNIDAANDTGGVFFKNEEVRRVVDQRISECMQIQWPVIHKILVPGLKQRSFLFFQPGMIDARNLGKIDAKHLKAVLTLDDSEPLKLDLAKEVPPIGRELAKGAHFIRISLQGEAFNGAKIDRACALTVIIEEQRAFTPRIVLFYDKRSQRTDMQCSMINTNHGAKFESSAEGYILQPATRPCDDIYTWVKYTINDVIGAKLSDLSLSSSFDDLPDEEDSEDVSHADDSTNVGENNQSDRILKQLMVSAFIEENFGITLPESQIPWKTVGDLVKSVAQACKKTKK